MSTHKIFPITRVHEPLLIDITVEKSMVTDAKVSGCLFRGFELMLKGRDPRDAIFFVQRICGICSTAHAIAAAYALEDAFNLTPTHNGQLIRNIIFAADILQNHLRHFYILTLPDYMKGPDYAPFTPKPKNPDYRIPKLINDKLLNNYWESARLSAKAHQLVAIWGTKVPHEQSIFPTGVSSTVDAKKIDMAIAIANELKEFIDGHFLNDVYTIANYYPDYFKLSRGYGNFLAFGLFPQNGKEDCIFPYGFIKNGSHNVEEFKPQLITEAVKYSWYDDELEKRKPADGITEPNMDKDDAYTWVKAPRYGDLPMEGGPLARLWINGKYRNGISAMDRIIARAIETQIIVNEILNWLPQIEPGVPTLEKYDMLDNAEGVGFTGSMRGQLGHWIKIKGGRIHNYQVVTPTSWNFSPRDNKDLRGPVEEALIGLQVKDPDASIEVARVIHAFDPCFSCAVHLISDQGLKKFTI